MKTFKTAYCSAVICLLSVLNTSSAKEKVWTSDPPIKLGDIMVSPGVITYVGTKVALQLDAVDLDTRHLCIDSETEAKEFQDTTLRIDWVVKKDGTDYAGQAGMNPNAPFKFIPREPGYYDIQAIGDDNPKDPDRNDNPVTNEITITVLKVDIRGLENVEEVAGTSGSWWTAYIGEQNPIFGLTSDSYVPNGVTWEFHEITTPPVGDATLTDNADNTATIDQGTIPTTYLIKAISVDNPDCFDVVYLNVYCACSDEDVGVHGDRSAGEYFWIADFASCDFWHRNQILWSTTDKCENTLVLSCSNVGCTNPPGYQYQLRYNGMKVGQCPYSNGENFGEYWLTADGCRIHSVSWTSMDDTNDGGAEDEGTPNKYDWMVYEYDCINGVGSSTALEGDDPPIGGTGSTPECGCSGCLFP